MDSTGSWRLLLLLSVLGFPLLVASDVLDDVCSPSPFPDFCIKTLRPDPRIPAAQGPSYIAVVLMDLVEMNNQQFIAGLQKYAEQAKDSADREALLIVASGYGTIDNRSFQDARDAFQAPTKEGKAEAFPPLVRAAQIVDANRATIKRLAPDLSYRSDFAFKGCMVCAYIAKSYIS